MNHYVLGGVLKHGHFVTSFAQAMDVLEEELKKIKEILDKANHIGCITSKEGSLFKWVKT